MSGIYIPDMKMPKENDYTIVIVYGDGVVTEYHDDYWIRGADGEKQIGTAVPVPPHGDLIDRDPFIDFIKTHWNSYDQWFVAQLEARPTIIPAEEEQT